MYTVIETNSQFQSLTKSLHEAITTFFELAQMHGDEVTLPAKSEVVSSSQKEEKALYLIKDGQVSYQLQDRTLFMYEEGDLMGLDSCVTQQLGSLRTDFAVIADRYEIDQVLSIVALNHKTLRQWIAVIEAHSACLKHLLGEFLQSQIQFQPQVLHFNPGEVIIQQGDSGDQVYTLSSGHAEVSVDGEPVGEVLADEIFGAIAPLTDGPRSATVTASRKSVVLALPQEKFSELIQTHPHTVHKLIQGMARKIVDLNKRVVQTS